jgi:hypothetical protein
MCTMCCLVTLQLLTSIFEINLSDTMTYKEHLKKKKKIEISQNGSKQHTHQNQQPFQILTI